MKPKTSWKVLRNEMTKNTRQDSAGYIAELCRAGKIFVALKEYFSDREAAEAEFNADTGVTMAFSQYAKLKKIGLI